MKTLKIYKVQDEIVLERVNEFNHASKRFFITENGLFEALDLYPNLDEYQLEVDKDLWAEVINHLNKENALWKLPSDSIRVIKSD